MPLIGNALSIGVKKPPYDVLLKWKDQYGPIYTYWFGETPIVAVNDFNLLKDTFIKDGETYTGRNFFTKIQKLMRGKRIKKDRKRIIRITKFSEKCTPLKISKI